MKKLLVGLAALPFVSGVAMAGQLAVPAVAQMVTAPSQPMVLSQTQMDMVTAGTCTGSCPTITASITASGTGSITVTSGNPVYLDVISHVFHNK